MPRLIEALPPAFGQRSDGADGVFGVSRWTTDDDVAPGFFAGGPGLGVVGQCGRGLLSAARLGRLLQDWTAYGNSAFNSLPFDFSLAIFDRARRELTLCLAPLSSLGLAYRHHQGRLHFSTLASSLATGSGANLRWLARQRGPEAHFGADETAFDGVYLVEPGTIVQFRAGEAAGVRRFWSARRGLGGSDAEVADALRSALDAAVEDVTSDISHPIAAHLSAGRDSGVVAATAARALSVRGKSLIAFTAIPSPSIIDRLVPGAYEGPGAVAVASMHRGMQHQLVSVAGCDLGALLDRQNAHLDGPYGTPANLPWWNRILELASEKGARLLLTGATGNLTVSAGGPWALGDLLGSGQFVAWARTMRQSRRARGASLTNLLATSFGPLVPEALYRRLLQLTRRRPHPFGATFLRGDLQQLTLAQQDVDTRPTRDWVGLLHHALETSANAGLNSEILYGVTLRDPTADRRVVEASLRLSLRQLASPYDQRPIFERAFADRLPPVTLRPAYRGVQGSDWFHSIDPVALTRNLRRYGESASVREYIDVDAMLVLIENWPSDGRLSPASANLFGVQLLPTVSLASFLHCHWPG